MEVVMSELMAKDGDKYMSPGIAGRRLSLITATATAAGLLPQYIRFQCNDLGEKTSIHINEKLAPWR